MKKIVKIENDENEGFLALIGQNVEIYCGNYIYAGKLVGVNDTCVKLENPHIVYETGAFNNKKYSDCQSMCKDVHYVTMQLMESFGPTSRL